MIDFAERNLELAQAMHKNAQLQRDLAEAEARKRKVDEYFNLSA
jgi:hypothetical protein